MADTNAGYAEIDWSKVDGSEQSTGAARAALTGAVGQDPDQVAKNLALAKGTGLPPDVVARNQDEVARQQKLDSLNFDEILNESPEAHKWLEDQHNAALIIDDPSMIGAMKRTLKDIPPAFSQGLDRNQLIDMRFKQLTGSDMTPEEHANMQALSDSMEGKQFGTGGLASDAITNLANFAPQMGKQFLRSGEGAVAGGASGAAIGAAIGNAPGAVAGLATGARVGWTAGSLYENFRQMSAQTYDTLNRIQDDAGNKINPDVARGAAIAVGLAAAPLDAYALGKLASVTPGVSQVQQLLQKDGLRAVLGNPGMRAAFEQVGQKLGRFGTALTAEGLAGAAQQVFSILGEEYAKEHSEGTFKPITAGEATDRVIQGAVTNMEIAGTLGAMNAPIDYYRSRNRVATPDQVAAQVDNINQAVRSSPLYQRSPDRFNDLVQTLSPDDKLYVNPEQTAQFLAALPQDRQDAILNAIPSLRDDLETSTQTGADISISKADYAGIIAPHPEADMLRDHIKLDPADTSVAERTAQAEFLKANPQVASDIAQQVKALPQDATYQEMVPAIERVVRKAMIDGGATPDEAKANAALYARTAARFATPFGQHAVDAVNNNLLEFQTVDEQGNPIKKGSNFSVLLNDLGKLKTTGRIAGADEAHVAAVRDFGARIEAAGITPEAASKLSSHELLDKLYPQLKQPELNLGDLGNVTLPDVTLSQDENGGVNINVRQGERPDQTGEVLKQAYKPPRAIDEAPNELKEVPQTPYNGTDSPEFKDWFGDSKVVDEKGKPKVLYHGTHADFTAFDKSKVGTKNMDYGEAFYFTDDPAVASDYASLHDPSAVANKEISKGANVMPIYLKMDSPLTLNYHGSDEANLKHDIALAKEEGYYDGVIVKNVNDGAGVINQYIVFDPTQIKSIFNSGKFSKIDPNILNQTERGFIQFTPSSDFAERLRHVTVAFTTAKNFSTGAHEFAHWGVAQHRMFAEMARERIAAGDNGLEIKRIADDWEALKKEVGADSDSFTVDQEEHIARAFESYMREGTAPSEKLRRIFTRFRDWLVKIYKDQKALDVPMSDDIRGIFDRWLASDEEIQQVRAKNGALAEMAQKFGLDKEIVDRVADYVNSATAHAEEKLYRKLSAEQNRRETKAYEDELGKMTKAVGDEFKQKREYNLINYLKENGLKMLEGPETQGVDPDIITDKHGENTIHPDDVADLYGYDSGLDMLRALSATKTFDQAVDREARSRLYEKYPDMIAAGKIHNEAVDAIINDRALLALDLMVNELGRKNGDNSRVGMKQFAIAMAQQQVEKMNLSQSNYGFRYEVAREKEIRLALKASRAGDSTAAMLHLQRAMVNQIIYKNLEQFRDLRQKAEDLFKRIDSADRDLAPTKDIDFLGAARFILYKFGLGGEDFDINKWIEDIQERDPDVMQDLIGLSLMVNTPSKQSKDLTISEFRDIHNSIKNIYDTARNMKELEIAGKKIKTDTAVGELIAQMGPPTKPLHDSTQIIGVNRFRNGVSVAKAALRRVEEWTRAMDGGNDGPFRKYIWRIANDAENNYKYSRDNWMKGYADILQEHKELLSARDSVGTQMFKSDTLGRTSRLVFRDNLELMGFLLHTGNESNLDKLLGGYGIDRATYYDEMKRLQLDGTIKKEHYDLAQKLWNYVEALKPETQRAFKKLYGFRFEEIENSPLQTEHGAYRGGYWPAIVDNDQAAINKTVQQKMEENRHYLLATTGKGFTKQRVDQYKQPLKTDLRLGSQHIDRVLRFVHLEPATRDISRILNRHEFRDLLKAHDFDAFDGMLMPWLQRFAQQTMEPPVTAGDRSATFGRQVIGFMRSAAVSQIIRYNPVVALQNVANLPVALRLVDKAELARTFIKTTTSPIDASNAVKSASKMMQERMNVQALKMAQIINQIADRKGNFAKSKDFAIRHGMIFMHAIDGYMGTAIWQAAYNEHQSAGHTDTDSIAHADRVIREVMGAGGSKDVSKMEASHPAVKAIMPFYSYFNAQANLIGTEFNNVMKQYGWAGSGKMFMAYISLIAAPAMVGDFVVQSLRGQLPNSDEDGQPLMDWMAWATESQLKYLSAMVPFAGQGVNAIINIAHGRPADDRISVSPVVSGLTTAAKAVGDISKTAGGGEVDDAKFIRDTMNGLGFALNIPLGQVSKPISYVVDVNEGNTSPDGPLDYMRGLVAGPPPKK
jgi:hypothetical protein